MNSNQLAGLSKPERLDLWVEIINRLGVKAMLELGVWRGEFAQHVLKRCACIMHYYMIDPWKHLDGWNKPANVTQAEFEKIHTEAIERTNFAADRRHVLRGQTVEVIEQIPDGSLDLVYIDADHTLRGITIDMIRTYPKVRVGGILGGDDYSPTIWQHEFKFEPTLVCPFAFYFAESAGIPIVIFPQNQFAMIKPDSFGNDFRVIDTTERYGPPELRPQISRPFRALLPKLLGYLVTRGQPVGR
jgi:hypothetical protein